jgi:hypothetical protein
VPQAMQLLALNSSLKMGKSISCQHSLMAPGSCACRVISLPRLQSAYTNVRDTTAAGTTTTPGVWHQCRLLLHVVSSIESQAA